MIAQIIAKGYQTLTTGLEEEKEVEDFELGKVILSGESTALEFKSTLRTNLHTRSTDPRMELSVLKTIAGFLNTNGGTLIVGVSDDGTPVGIDVDGFPNEDKMSLHLVNIVKTRMGPLAMTHIHLHFEDVKDGRVMVVKCAKAAVATFVRDGEVERFYIRMGPSTSELTPSQTQQYIKQRYKD